MLDSLAKDNLLKVLERVAPEALVPSFIANLQQVADEISSVQKAMKCEKRQRAATERGSFPGHHPPRIHYFERLGSNTDFASKWVIQCAQQINQQA